MKVVDSSETHSHHHHSCPTCVVSAVLQELRGTGHVLCMCVCVLVSQSSPSPQKALVQLHNTSCGKGIIA